MTNLFEEIQAKQAELDTLMKDYGSDAIKDYLKDFWEKAPEVKSIRWRQYTPYFNDGEPCVFRVNDVCAKLVDTPEDAGDYEDGYEDWWSLQWNLFPDVSREEREEKIQDISWLAALDALNKVWQGNEKTLLIAFGDHVEVTADREQITVEEYYHD